MMMNYEFHENLTTEKIDQLIDEFEEEGTAVALTGRADLQVRVSAH